MSVLGALGIAAAFAAPIAPEIHGPPPGWSVPAPVTITLAATGDVIPHGRVRDRARQEADPGDPASGWVRLLGAAASPLAQADLAFANLETPIAPTRGRPGRAWVFNGPTALPDALSRIGVDLVAAANNHAYDQGIAGVLETVETVRASGLRPIGAGSTCAAAWEATITPGPGGRGRIAWLGMTRILNTHATPDHVPEDGPCVAHWGRHDRLRVRDAVRAAARRADLVIVSLHHGTEYAPTPNRDAQDAVTWLFDAGADLVLGHHPHVLGPVVQATGPRGPRLVAHSLGNALSNQGWAWRPDDDPVDGDVRDGVVLTATITFVPGLPGPVSLHWDAVPLWSDNDARSVGDPATPLRVVPAPPARAERIRRRLDGR